MADHFVEAEEEKDLFFSEKDKQAIKASFIGSLKAGISIATFVAPMIIVFGVGTMIGNFFKSE